MFLKSVKPWPLTASRRQKRREIETEQCLLTSIIKAKDINEIERLMVHRSVSNAATLLAVNANAHPKNPDFAHSIDALLPEILAFSGQVSLTNQADIKKSHAFSQMLEVTSQLQSLVEKMMLQNGPLSPQKPAIPSSQYEDIVADLKSHHCDKTAHSY